MGSISTPVLQMRKLRPRKVMHVSPKFPLLVNAIPGQPGSDIQALKCYYPMQRPERFADSNLPSSPALVLPPLTRQPQPSPPLPMCLTDSSGRVGLEGFGGHEDLGLPLSGCERHLLHLSFLVLISCSLAGPSWLGGASGMCQECGIDSSGFSLVCP